MPVARRAAEPGSGTVLAAAVNGWKSCVGGGGPSFSVNGPSVPGELSVVTTVVVSPLSGDVTVLVSGGVDTVLVSGGVDVESVWVGGVAPPVGPAWAGGGVVGAWKLKSELLADAWFPECVKARKRPAPAAAPVPASHTRALLLLSAGGLD